MGAFACYGYRKDPEDHNRLLVDPPAAQVVRRIFDLFEQGYGKLSIAKLLNREGLPSPSAYKSLTGARYHNGRRLEDTTYWTYATIHRILQNRMYAGDMEQGRTLRPVMHGKARQKDRADWTVVPDTHEAIIDRAQWDRVQTLLAGRTRQTGFTRSQSPFAGFLRCGDCGRAMVKTTRAGGVWYSCGSYRRYGPAVCSGHNISHAALEEIVLEDLNRVIGAAGDLGRLAGEDPQRPDWNTRAEWDRLEAGLERARRLRKGAYEDYREGLLSRGDYIRYQEDYRRQETAAAAQLEQLQAAEVAAGQSPWAERLLRYGKLTELDRLTVAESIRQILIFGDGHIEITYAFSNRQGLLPA